ncbi:PH domain-containing protein [Streptomyces xiaopingdaonensis]|uniref:PH domain-containing protein n=1 Tax=Streptomyces xiaopingdaonensis TaxID=1565415 RepID=UPI0002D9BC36|nr:PH domain-containing protein [Streptomyces xiaopingdaonensis]
MTREESTPGDDRPEGRGTTADEPGEQRPEPPAYADRVFRSPAGMAGGVLLLLLALWLGTDAIVNSDGRTPWITLAGLFVVVPLVVAFTLRPAVFAGERRLRVRNPFRTVSVPWGAVESLRSGYSSEVVADGRTYQLWSIPVSLRARNKATRHNERVAAGRPPSAAGGLFGGRTMPSVAKEPEQTDRRAPSDQAMDDLRSLAERHGADGDRAGGVAVRWAYEVLAPAAAGVVALAVLLATG